jgi:hypothetical protein
MTQRVAVATIACGSSFIGLSPKAHTVGTLFIPLENVWLLPNIVQCLPYLNVISVLFGKKQLQCGQRISFAKFSVSKVCLQQGQTMIVFICSFHHMKLY